MKPYSLLLATSSLLIADQWGEASVALAQTEPDLETGDDAAQVQSERSERSATTLFIDDIAQPDSSQPESFAQSSLSPSSSSLSSEARSPLSPLSTEQLSIRAIAQPELTATPMQWMPSPSSILDRTIDSATAADPSPSLQPIASSHEAPDPNASLPALDIPAVDAAADTAAAEVITSAPSSLDRVADALASDTEAVEAIASTPSSLDSPSLETTSDIPAEEASAEKAIASTPPSSDILSLDIPAADTPAEEVASEDVSSEEAIASAYLRPPQIVPDESVPVFLTAIPLNGRMVHHQQGWTFGQEFTTGDHRNTTVLYNGSYHLGSQVSQSVSNNNVFNLDMSGRFVQMDTVQRQREVKIDQRLPRRMLGLHLQQTFTGACVGRFAEAVTDPTDQCTLTPPLVTDRESLNEFFMPTRINQPGQVGDVISRDSLDGLEAPGFQNEGVNGETVGLDLYFPNIGLIERDTDGATINVQQTEEFDEDQVVFVSRVNQQIQSNDTRSIVGRTIRGHGFIQDDDNFWLNALVAAATELLPSAETRLAGSLNPANTKINRNLFRAANNQWTPGNSWTFYHTGFGSTTHTSDADREAGRSPNGHYHGVWVGLSPVTERERTSEVYLDATGPERVLADEGDEGGSNSDISFISRLNGDTFDSEQLDAFYSQIYLRFLERDVDLVTSDKLVETTTYRPHVSFSGNVTNANQSVRYYVGAIAADEFNPYVGGDFTRHTRRWQLNVGGVGYLNPDHDYFSQVQGSVGRQVHLGNRTNITFFSGMRYAIDQSSDPLEEPLDNFLSLGTRTNIGPVSLGLTHYLDDVLPESIDATLSADLALRLSKRMVVRGYYAPIDNRNNFGASADYRLGNTIHSPVLSLGWSHRGQEFGQDLDGNTLSQSSDRVTLQLQFGGKNRPISF